MMDCERKGGQYTGYCFIVDCPSKRDGHLVPGDTGKLHFFDFPDKLKNIAVRNQWILFSARDDGKGGLLQPVSQRICSRHFHDQDIVKYSTDQRVDRRKPLVYWRLKDSSVCPSVFPPVKSHPVETAVTSRSQDGICPSSTVSTKTESQADCIDDELSSSSFLHLESIGQVEQ